jgi:hypothetical protein
MTHAPAHGGNDRRDILPVGPDDGADPWHQQLKTWEP